MRRRCSRASRRTTGRSAVWLATRINSPGSDWNVMSSAAPSASVVAYSSPPLQVRVARDTCHELSPRATVPESVSKPKDTRPGSRTPESLEDYLKHFRFGFQRPPLPVHRLDRDTSGCLLLARNPKAHKRFQRAFEAKQVTKT